METVVTLSVKGVLYYKGAELYKSGSLQVGTQVRLEWERDNSHDPNAVAVKVRNSGAKLGHISKELAPKYSKLVRENKIRRATVSSVSVDAERLHIKISVAYEQAEKEIQNRQDSNFAISIGSLTTGAGVYSITCLSNGRQYIGSSLTVLNRVTKHLHELTSGNHSNQLLQEDFNLFGYNGFKAKTVSYGGTKTSIETLEGETIRSLLAKGGALYNLTSDGKGAKTRVYPHGKQQSVSDRHVPSHGNELPSNTNNQQRLPSGCLSVLFLFCLTGIGIATGTFFLA